jgi:hypothetical protein
MFSKPRPIADLVAPLFERRELPEVIQVRGRGCPPFRAGALLFWDSATGAYTSRARRDFVVEAFVVRLNWGTLFQSAPEPQPIPANPAPLYFLEVPCHA